MRLHWLSLLILLVLSGMAVAIYIGGNEDDVSRVDFRTRVIHQFRVVGIQAQQRLRDRTLSEMLKNAGLPISAALYQSLRGILTLLSALYAVRVNLHTSDLPLYAMPVAIWFLFSYRLSWGPMKRVLTFLQTLHQERLHQELYSLYIMTKDLLAYHREHPRTVYDIFLSLTPLMERLQPLMRETLIGWPKNPDRALERFAEQLGSNEAKEFTDILRQIEHSDSSVVIDILERRHLSFQKDRISAYRRRLYLRGLFGYVLGIGGFALVAWDLMTVLSIYSEHLLTIM